MVCKFSCSNNINATNSMVHWGYFTMILDVASGLLATYFIYIRESNRTDCFAEFVYFCAYILRFHLLS